MGMFPFLPLSGTGRTIFGSTRTNSRAQSCFCNVGPRPLEFHRFPCFFLYFCKKKKENTFSYGLSLLSKVWSMKRLQDAPSHIFSGISKLLYVEKDCQSPGKLHAQGYRRNKSSASQPLVGHLRIIARGAIRKRATQRLFFEAFDMFFAQFSINFPVEMSTKNPPRLS